MDKMKVSTKKPYRLNLRLTEKEMDFINNVCDILNLSPSEYIRKMIDKQMYVGGKDYENQ